MENLSNIETKFERNVNLLEQFGLFWEVKKVPLITPDGDETDYFGTQRTDTKQVFSTVKNGYQVLQNWELAELITECAGQFDMEVSRGGSFNGGARVYLQIATGEIKGIGKNFDTVQKYLTAMNSHDGSSGVGFGMSNITISCSNTFHRAYKSHGMERIRHSMSMRERLDAMLREFEKVKDAEVSLYDKFIRMSEEEATKEDITEVIKLVTGVDVSVKTEQADDLYSKYQLNQTETLFNRIKSETVQKGNTLWGLFNGVTKYTNTDMRVPNRENGLLESKFIGGANKADNKVFKLLSIV